MTRRVVVVAAVVALTGADVAHATTRPEAKQTSKAFAVAKMPEVRRFTPQGIAWVKTYAGSCSRIPGGRWGCQPVILYRTKAGEHKRCAWDIVVMAPMAAAEADGGCF
jgi:hypothetical protein